MKYSMRPLVIITVLTTVLFALGCASRPDAELKLTQEAMEAAKNGQAAEFAPADWKAAVEVWDQAQDAISKQSYGNAKALLDRAKARFEKAQVIAKAKVDDVRNELAAMTDTLGRRVTDLKNTVDSSGLSSDRKKQLTESCQGVQVLITKVSTQMNEGKFTEARATGQEALKSLNEVEKNMGGH